MTILSHIIQKLTGRAKNTAYRPFDEEVCELIQGLFAEIAALKLKVHKLETRKDAE